MAQKILFETKLTDVAISDIEGVGVLRNGEDGRKYRWVKNRNATAFTAKQPVCYDAGNVSTIALYQAVNSPVAADLMLAAGIAMTAMGKSGGTTGCYGWVQVEGYFENARVTKPKTAAIALGQELICVNTETLLSNIGAATVGNACVYSSHFVALQAQTTTGTGATAVGAVDVMVRCL